MSESSFWLLWFLTLAVCASVIVQAVSRPARLLEWPFLASSMWAFFFVYMAYDAKVSLGDYLGETGSIGQFVVLICLLAIIAGWELGKRKYTIPKVSDFVPSLGLVWTASLLFVMVGAVGAYSVSRAAREGTMDYQNTSAYWYLLFYIGYPGLAIGVWAACKWQGGGRIWIWTTTWLVLIAFLFPHVLNARRGPVFPAVLILLLVPAMTLRRAPRRIVYITGLTITGFVMLAFVPARIIVYNGGSWQEAIKEFNFNTTVTERNKKLSDNEFMNSCHEIDTLNKNGKFQFGTGHLGLLLHWIPRSWYRDGNKPVIGEGNYTFDELFDDVERNVGVRLLGGGASSAGVADSFLQYGWLCPLYWFGLSFMFARAFCRAIIQKDVRWIMAYVGFMCASHWLVSQSMAAAFVPGAFFQFIPFVVFRFCPSLRFEKTTFRKLTRKPIEAPPSLPT